MTAPRFANLQRHFGLPADGIAGPVTLTALERALMPPLADAEQLKLLLTPRDGLVISRKALDKIVAHEIVSEAYYRQRLQQPIWPGGASGVTVAIGYDLGYQTAARIASDWRAHLLPRDVELLQQAAGVKAAAADRLLLGNAALRSVRIPLAAAKEVFYLTSLPRYARDTRRAYPGVEQLPADAQGAMLSLVYNRGTSMAGATRREMAELRPLVASGDLAGMAAKIREMKRLWIGKGLDGLLRRRDEEAELIQYAHRPYVPHELIRVS